jgi:N-acetylmuramoyl-L-alanine amidase
MRPATGCSGMHMWRCGTVAAALVVLALPAARAGDVDAVAPTPQHAAACTQAASFRTVVDVGHGIKAPGALSARGVDEYDFNLRLSREIAKELRAAGFAKTVLMVTPDKPTRGLFKRVARAKELKADLFFAIHHDSVPDKMMETWQVDGKTRHYNDRFPGHSIFISNSNGDRVGSLAFARLLGLALKEHGLKYTPHYTEKFMGNRRRELVDAQAGVYRYDQLIVLKDSLMPAALLEAGSIVNRSEELLLATPEHEAIIASAAVEAVDAFCVERSKAAPVVAAAKPDRPKLAAKQPDAPKASAKKSDGTKAAAKKSDRQKVAKRSDEAKKTPRTGWFQLGIFKRSQ